MVALRAHDEIDDRCAARDLTAFGLRDATCDGDKRLLAFAAALIADITNAAEIGVDLFDGFLADVAGVEDDEIGVFYFGSFGIQ